MISPTWESKHFPKTLDYIHWNKFYVTCVYDEHRVTLISSICESLYLFIHINLWQEVHFILIWLSRVINGMWACGNIKDRPINSFEIIL